MTPLTEAVRQWIADDPDGSTRAELESLLAQAAPAIARAPGETGPYQPANHLQAEAALASLRDRFSGSLEFGTAGLRGKLGAGPNRMNRAVVIRAAAGLMDWLTDEIGEWPTVIIGYDARRGSARFAYDTAAVVVAAGGSAFLMPAALPTPLLAFAVQRLGADAGVMVTASHNPKEDNGYKVYLGGRCVPAEERGAQIVPPVDAQIAARIAAAPPARHVPQAKQGWRLLGEEVREAYLARLRTHVAHPDRHTEATPGPLRIVATPLHGIGGDTLVRALAGGGFTDVHLVPRQAQPDPDFPTVPFPNPEEDGALDLAVEFASALNADLILALDPDADRCSAAIPTADGSWRQLTGDEIGALLGEQAAGIIAQGRPSTITGGRTLATTVVSSRLLAKIAAEYGMDYATTLTGFKWICRAPGLAFGYEEAIGYCVDPEGVRDKDGISAALRICQLADTLRRRGSDLAGALDALAARHGVHHTTQLAVRLTDPTLIALAMERLRTTPPVRLAGSPVVASRDLAEGTTTLPPTDGLEFITALDDRVVVRPSGTEPKLKCYLEVVEPVTWGADGGTGGDQPLAGDPALAGGTALAGDPALAAVPAARRRAAARMAELRADVSAGLGL